MTTSALTKRSNGTTLAAPAEYPVEHALEQNKRRHHVAVGQLRAATLNRRSLYAVGLGLRLLFFFGLIAHAMVLLNQW